MKAPVSSFTSKYHQWFCDMGYPQLDLRFVRENNIETGEWAIYEILTGLVPAAEVRWRDVLTGMKNVEINRTNLKRFVDMIDLTKREAQERHEKKTEAVEKEYEMVQKTRLQTIDRIHKSYIRNPALMERVARNGLSELDPRAIARHIPRYRL